MSTRQALKSAPQSKGTPAPAGDGVTAAMARQTSAQAETAPTSPASSPPTAKDQPTALTDKIRRDAAALRNALAFTQAVGVLMRSAHYKQYTLGDLEWLVIPPLLAGQFRIGEAKPDNQQGPSLPVAVVLWASVSPEVDKRLMEAKNASPQLKPEEWKSGDILWLVHAAGETRFVRFVVDQLMKTTFKGRQVKIIGRDREGNAKVHTMDGSKSA